MEPTKVPHDDMKDAANDQGSLNDIASRLRLWLEMQGLVGRSRLPPERTLTNLLRCSRRQIRAALAILDQEGLVQKQNARTRVIGQQPRQIDGVAGSVLLVANPTMFVTPDDPRGALTCHKQLMELTGRLRSQGLTVHTVPDNEHSLNLVCRLLMHRPRAIIINDGSLVHRTARVLIESARKAGIQTILFGDNVPADQPLVLGMDAVVFDHAGGVSALVDHAAKRGKRRLLRITFAHPPDQPEPIWSQDQESGLRLGCQRNRIAYHPTVRCHIGVDDVVADAAYHRHRIVAGYLAEHFADPASAPQVLLAGTDYLLPTLVGALGVLRIRCGVDVDIYGYDNAVELPHLRRQLAAVGYFPMVTVQAETGCLIEQALALIHRPPRPPGDLAPIFQRAPMRLIDVPDHGHQRRAGSTQRAPRQPRVQDAGGGQPRGRRAPPSTGG